MTSNIAPSYVELPNPGIYDHEDKDVRALLDHIAKILAEEYIECMNKAD